MTTVLFCLQAVATMAVFSTRMMAIMIFHLRTATILSLLMCGTSNRSVVFALAAPTSNAHGSPDQIINLQRFHVERSPSESLAHLSKSCERLGVTDWDAYGDFDKTADASFLRRFEAEVAQELGVEDSVVMPSGGMAQSIALLVHQADVAKQTGKEKSTYFACHHTSHLLLYEEEAYRELLHMEPLIIDTKVNVNTEKHPFSIPPMEYATTKVMLDEQRKDHGRVPSTLMLELPHRELGGKVTPYEDILQLQDYCDTHNIRFHMDGARLFEASTGYNEELSLKELAASFDSVYLSFYKGLGGMTGAMLLGSKNFCEQARIWLRRFGGNVYTILPYAVSGWAGFRRQWRLEEDDDEVKNRPISFLEKKGKLKRLVEALSTDDDIAQVLAFDPAIPHTNIVHGYLSASVEKCMEVLDAVEKNSGIRVLFRVRPVSEEQAPEAYRLGYRAYFELTIGEANAHISDDVFLRGWRAVARGLLEADDV